MMSKKPKQFAPLSNISGKYILLLMPGQERERGELTKGWLASSTHPAFPTSPDASICSSTSACTFPLCTLMLARANNPSQASAMTRTCGPDKSHILSLQKKQRASIPHLLPRTLADCI